MKLEIILRLIRDFVGYFTEPFVRVFNKFKEVRESTPIVKSVLRIALFFYVLGIIIKPLIKYIEHSFSESTLQILRAFKLNLVAESFVLFFEHSWFEILIGILIFVSFEARIKKLFEAPKNVGPRNHKEILEAFSQNEETNQLIRILDTSIHTFIDKEEIFIDALNKALINPNMKIQILLLHPDSYAAKQRSIDLSNKTRDILVKMKEGLAKLDSCLKRVVIPKGCSVEVKLFKATPIMIYTAWDEKSNFGLLPSDNYADNNHTFLVNNRGDLGQYFTNYFDTLWIGNKEKSNKTVFLEDYLYGKIGSIKVYWGGISNDREKPKYVTPKDHIKDFDNYVANKTLHKFSHDGTTTLVRLKAKSTEYDFASEQISKTYGGNNQNPQKNPIYELEYYYDKFQVKLENTNLIKEKLEKRGYAFVSHKQYDIDLNQQVRTAFNAIAFCMDHLIEPDTNDEEAIDYLKNQFKSYKNNPRKRLFATFTCHLSKGVCSPRLTEDQTYNRPFSIPFDENRSSKVKKSREFKTLYQIKEDLELKLPQSSDSTEQDIQKTISTVIKTIQTTIQADLLYILGEDDFINSDIQFKINAHIIRTEVGDKGSLDNTASPTNSSKNLNYTFHAVHLINRVNVEGGVSNIVFESEEKDDKRKLEIVNVIEGYGDYFLLEKPLDALIFCSEFKIEVNNYPAILKLSHETKNITLEKEQHYGYRDVLVLEFSKM